MKKNIILVLLIGMTGIGLPENLAGQNLLYQFETGSDQSLDKTLELLSYKFGLNFSYESNLPEGKYFSEGNYIAVSIEGLLQKIFNDQNLDFRLSGKNNILIRNKPETLISNSSEESNLTGLVLDGQNGEPLAFALIFSPDLRYFCYTDSKGYFKLDIPSDQDMGYLEVQCLGFKPKRLSLSDLNINPLIVLSPEAFTLRQVTVSSGFRNLQFKALSNALIPELNYYQNIHSGGLAGVDIFRNLHLLPGVTAHEDGDAALKIRGGEPDETLIILDDIPIYKADHFYGVFASINPGFVDEIELYRNHLPIEYGGKTSGMVLMRSPEKPGPFHAVININLLTASMDMQIPIGNKIGLWLSGRTTYKDASENPLFSIASTGNSPSEFPDFSRNRLLKTDPNFRFYDVNGKIRIEPSTGHEIGISFFRSLDKFKNAYEVNYLTNILDGPVINMEEFNEIGTWSNTGLSSFYKIKASESSSLKISAYHSENEHSGELSSTLIQRRDQDTIHFAFANSNYNQIREDGAKFELDQKMGLNSNLKTGVTFIHFSNELLLTEDREAFLDYQDSASEVRLFAAYRNNISDKFQFETGFRLSRFSGTDQFYFSPQIHANYHISDLVSLKASVSRNYQFAHELIYENRLGQSMDFFVLSNKDNFSVGASTNFMLGAILEKGPINIDLELFYKDISGVMEYALLANGFDHGQTGPHLGSSYKLFTGTGKAAGAEAAITLNKGHYSGWWSYTLSKSIVSFPEILNNESFAAQNDRTHQLKWVNNLHIGSFEFNFNYIFSSGKPYTDISMLSQSQDRRGLRAIDRQKRLPAYHRLDLGGNYNFKMGPMNGKIGLSVFNLTNRQNVKYLQYVYSFLSPNDEDTSRNHIVVGSETDLLPRTLNLNLWLKF